MEPKKKLPVWRRFLLAVGIAFLAYGAYVHDRDQWVKITEKPIKSSAYQLADRIESAISNGDSADQIFASYGSEVARVTGLVIQSASSPERDALRDAYDAAPTDLQYYTNLVKILRAAAKILKK